MTIRHKQSTGSIYLIPDPGAVICQHCPLHPDTCGLSIQVPNRTRELRQEPDCLIDYLYWRLPHTTPAQALRIGDQAAQTTIAKSGKLLRWWYRQIEVQADRAEFVAGLANS